ncbi:MAG TPA: hypothetical protein VKE49_03730 [Myxococcaceae bacterium]|nr:hypothetical protein [Myxococcaceae bacterium]
MRKALATLPWVEQASIQTDVNTREVRFNLTDKKAFDAEAVKAALKEQSFPAAEVKSAP